MLSTHSKHLLRRTASTTTTLRPLTTSSSSSHRPLKLAIIGSGPSGFYTASKILQTLPRGTEHGDSVEAHMYDRLPTPYGLARYGVAPDHPEVKNCQHKFDELAPDPRFRFFGNVSIGHSTSPLPHHPSSPYTYPSALHIPLSTLYAHYTTLLFAYGSSLSTPLPHTPGSSSRQDRLENVFPALAFVNWYNGHPAYTHLSPDLNGEKVTIIGQGNVAMDCARILLKPPRAFEGTDMPSSIISHLTRSKVKEVELVGRRGPGQVAFTTKEFREMIHLDREGVKVEPVRGEEMDKAKQASRGDRARSRLLDLMSDGVVASSKKKKTKTNDSSTIDPNPAPLPDQDKSFKLSFLLSPKSFLPTSSTNKKIHSIRWTKNTLLAPPSTPGPALPGPPADPQLRAQGSSSGGSGSDGLPPPAVLTENVLARPTGEEVDTCTGMVIESVGYRGESIASAGAGQGEDGARGEGDVPFDHSRSRVMNVEGRVTDGSGVMIPGMYTAGWIASGPIGVIASTMQRAYAVASTIMTDHFQSPLPSASSSLLSVNPEMGVVPDYIRRSGVRVVELKDWERIDRVERENGEKRGKVREKFVSVEEMLKVLD